MWEIGPIASIACQRESLKVNGPFKPQSHPILKALHLETSLRWWVCELASEGNSACANFSDVLPHLLFRFSLTAVETERCFLPATSGRSSALLRSVPGTDARAVRPHLGARYRCACKA